MAYLTQMDAMPCHVEDGLLDPDGDRLCLMGSGLGLG